MDKNKLAVALRKKASHVRFLNTETSEESESLRDASSLLRVLAALIEGESLHKAFGSPGDWGYETEIGQALIAADVVPNAV